MTYYNRTSFNRNLSFGYMSPGPGLVWAPGSVGYAHQHQQYMHAAHRYNQQLMYSNHRLARSRLWGGHGRGFGGGLVDLTDLIIRRVSRDVSRRLSSQPVRGGAFGGVRGGGQVHLHSPGFSYASGRGSVYNL